MVFSIIASIVAVIITVLLGFYAVKEYSDIAGLGAFGLGFTSLILIIFLLAYCAEVRENKALIRSHLENPTNYTYSQLAKHNEFVDKAKVWQGTIFSFYNDVDLQSIDINSVSQKVIIESK